MFWHTIIVILLVVPFIMLASLILFKVRCGDSRMHAVCIPFIMLASLILFMVRCVCHACLVMPCVAG